MTVVLCDDHECKFNHEGVCHHEAIHIVRFKEAWDCSAYVYGFRDELREEYEEVEESE